MASKTSLGIEENIAGALSYVLGFISGAFFYLIEKKNKFVRFHALQSILIFGLLWILNYVLISGIFFLGFISTLISPLISVASFVLWLFLMFKAYKGEKYKLPVIGEYAEKHS